MKPFSMSQGQVDMVGRYAYPTFGQVCRGAECTIGTYHILSHFKKCAIISEGGHNMNNTTMLDSLDRIYKKSIGGLEYISPPIEKFAFDYTSRYPSVNSAAKAMLKNQVRKCTTSGFITGFGGAITMPVTIPANIGSVLYVQMRMIACTAYMAGYDLNSDQVQTFVYACLAGVSVTGLLKSFGVRLGTKVATKSIEKIPGRIIAKINQRIGFRLVTKFGQKGLINIGKLVPVVGSAINGGLDYAETKVMADRAYKMFIEGDLSVGEEIIDIASS